jgi:hypothetical protein
MEAMCSSETSVDSQRTTRRYIPEGGTLHNHRGEHLKSYKYNVIWVTVLNLFCTTVSNFIPQLLK